MNRAAICYGGFRIDDVFVVVVIVVSVIKRVQNEHILK